jgi:hypothetical protein
MVSVLVKTCRTKVEFLVSDRLTRQEESLRIVFNFHLNFVSRKIIINESTGETR